MHTSIGASGKGPAGSTDPRIWVDTLSGVLSLQQELHLKMLEQREWLQAEFAWLRDQLSNGETPRNQQVFFAGANKELDEAEAQGMVQFSMPVGAELPMDWEATQQSLPTTLSQRAMTYDTEMNHHQSQAADYLQHDVEWQKNIRRIYIEKSRQVRQLRRRALEKVREVAPSLTSPNDASIFYRIVQSRKFEALVMVMILIDAAYTGFFTDHELRALYDTMNGYSGELMSGSWAIFASLTVFFIVELVLRILAMRVEFLLSSDWQTGLLDTFLVAASLPALFDDTNQVAIVLRMLRVGRLFKLAVVLRHLRLFPSLRLMVRSIYSTYGLLFWALVMMFLAIYIFSLFFMVIVRVNFLNDRTNLVGEAADPAEEDLREWTTALFKYFGTMDRSMWTLYKVITGGKDWGDVVETLEGISYFLKPIFGLYMFGMLFGIMSILVGLFCDKASTISNLDQDVVVKQTREEVESLIDYMTDIFRQMDPENTGAVTWYQFRDFMGDENCQDFFAAKGLNVLDARALFQLLDEIDNNPDGRMDLGSFLQGMVRICGPAKNADLLQVLYEQRRNAALMMSVAKELRKQAGMVRTFCASTPSVALRSTNPLRSDQLFKPESSRQGTEPNESTAGI